MRRRKSGWPLYGLLGVLLVGGLVLLVSSAQAASTTFTPDADSYVKSDTPTTNFGSATTLRVDNSPTTITYIRFTVTGTSGAVTNALLRVFANSAQSVGYDVYQVSGTPPTFTESAVNFNNAPALLATKIGSSGPTTASTWTNVDVTSVVTGNGTYEFGLQTTSSTALSLASRESGANAPQLVVTTGGVSPPTNTGLPVISGILQVGQVLTTTDGTWTGSPIGFAYQWRSCSNATDLGTCSNIASATGKSYTLTSSELGKFMRVDVTATNGGGPTTATSNATAAVQAAAGNPSPYLVTRGVSDYTAASQTTSSTFTGSLKFVVESATAALEAAGGGTINFAPGDFDLGTDFFLLHQIHNITFAGAGIDVTTIHNSNSTAADTEPFNFGGAFNVTVRDMTVNAGGALRSTSDALDFDQGNDSLVERVKITGSRSKGIIFDGKNDSWTADRNTVRNCVITGVPSQGIEFLASSDNLVEGCTITNTASHGIEIAKASATGTGIQNNKKSNNNTIRNNTIDQAGGDGISVNSSDGNQITGNTITNSANVTAGRDGIRIFSADSIACNNNAVSNNTATDNQTPKTQAYGLRIASSLCSATVVGSNNFAGNLTGTILDLGTNTQYSTPTVPTNVQASVISSSEIDLSWTASTDDVAVVGYHVFDGGVQIANVTSGTAYAHTGLGAGTTHSYTVSAYDAVPNESAQSSPPAVATTSGGGGGGVAFVRQATNSGTGTSLAVSIPATGAGHALVAAVAVAAGSSATVTNVTDSGAGTWTRGPVGFLSGTNSRVEIWYRLNASSVTSVTATLSASKSLAVSVSEWSGVATASGVDASSGSGFASSTSPTTPLLATANANDVVIGAINYPANATSTLSTGSFTGLTNFGFSTTVHGRAAYRLTSATGSFQVAWSLTAASGGNGGAMLALKAASGGGGGGPPAPTLTLTESDATDFVSGATVFYRPTAASGSFTVTAVSSGATSVQFPVVFGSDGPNDTTSPFQQIYSWTSGASATGAKSVTAANGSGTSPASTFTVTPDSGAPTTTSQCNGSACSGSFSSSSAVTVTLVRSDAGSGVQATYYTTDGSTPTTSSPVYSAPFAVSTVGTTPVKFFTVDNVGNQDSVQTLNVTITGGGGGIAFVQQVVASGTAASLPVTVPATGAGHALVAVIALAAGSSASVSSVTDSASGTWTAGPVGFLTGVNSRVEIWYRLNAPSVTSVTVTLSAAKSAAVNVSEWSGVATASAVDGSLGGSGASSTTASTPLLTTTNATDLVIGAINYPAAATSSPPSGSFTSLTDFNSTTSVHGRAAYRITSATGSFQASWPLSIASGGNGGAILALKAA